MIEKLQAGLSEGQAAVVESLENRRYYTGIETSNGVLAVTARDACFFTDFRYITAAKNRVPKQIEVRLLTESKPQAVRGYWEGQKLQTVYFEEESLSYQAYCAYKEVFPQLSLVPGGQKIASFRKVKTETEIAHIRAAQKITDRAFTHICGFIRAQKNNSLTEKAIALELEFFMRKNGSGPMPFSVISASGPNSALPHAEPSERTVCPGDFVTMDFGSTVAGYASDMTRTVAIGAVSEKQRQVYQTVLAAQKKALGAIHAGITGAQADGYARRVIEEAGYGKFFGHSLGHSVGLQIHEEPNFSPRSQEIIPENAVVSVEPGIYLEGEFGVRIEDLVVVRNGGVEDLTESEKELLIL